MELIDIIALIFLFALYALVLSCSHEKMKAIQSKDENAAARYETFERLFIVMFGAALVGYILLCNQTLMAKGFGEVLLKLEELKNG